jgi:hypothetical protein
MTAEQGEGVTSGLVSNHTSPMKNNLANFFVEALARSTSFAFVISLAAITLKGQDGAPTSPYSDRAELSKVEEWVLSQGAAESIAPELAAILGLGSDRLPVKLKSFRMSDGVSRTFAVSTNPIQKGIVLSALKTVADKMKIYSVGTAWLTDRSGSLRRTIAVDASGARVLPDNSRAAEFTNIKAFFVKKANSTAPTIASSPSPRTSATAARGKEETR